MGDLFTGESEQLRDKKSPQERTNRAPNAAPGDRSSLRFVRLAPDGATGDRSPDEDHISPSYASRFARLMGARLLRVQALPSQEETAIDPQTLSTEFCDLVFCESVPPGDLMRNSDQASLPSLMIGRQNAWPIRRILLVVRGEATDAPTVEWGVRLAKRSGGQVTVLVVLPTKKKQRDHQASQIADVLARHTTPGRYVRQVLNRMAALNIDTVLRVSQGAPALQVRQELTQHSYELVITSIEPPGRLLNRYLETLIEPLLQWTQASVLVARTPPLWKRQASKEEKSG